MDVAALLDLRALRTEKNRRSIEKDREAAAKSFAAFVRLAWPILEPSTPLIWGWHLDAVCEHVEALLRGTLGNRRLLIAIPPGTAKSLISSVLSIAWQWGPGEKPGYRVLCASYSGTLSTRDAVRCRRLVESPWYQERWPEVQLVHDQNQKTRYETTSTGLRVATSVGGTVTGDRGNLIVCDDLLSVRRADSDAHRKEASDFFWTTLPTRLNDQRRDSMLVIAQRLHQADTIGEILERDPDRWEKLVLPMRFEPARRASTSLGWTDPREEDGELLAPEQFPEVEIKALEEGLQYAAPGQLQQRPAPREGAIFKVAWFQYRYRLRGERPSRVVLSLDCASKASERNDPTAAGVFAEFSDRYEIWHVDVRRQEFPALVRWVKTLAEQWKPSTVLIEDKDAGQQLIQQLRADTVLPVVAYSPGSMSKETRALAQTSMFEAGKVHLPESAPWIQPYVSEMTTFPAASHDDQVDMTSQALDWLRETAGAMAAIRPIVHRKTSARDW